MIRGAVLLAAIASPALADTDPVSLTLSPEMQRVLDRGFVAAAHQIGITFEQYSNDGETIVIADLDTIMELKRADRRAQMAYGYIVADLNWDGQVSREELEQVLSSPGQRPFVDGYFADGDLNSDGVITLSEMQQDAQVENPYSGARLSVLREIIGWDLNADGILHVEEALAVLTANEI